MLTKTRPGKPSKVPAPEISKLTAISAPKFAIMELPIHGMPGSPLVIHAFSAKARETMKSAQEAGSVGRKGKKREPKDFDAAYHGARHISTDGWDGMNAAAFRNAAIDACRLVGYKMTHAKLSLFIEADGVSATEGTPLVRIHGEPKPFEAVTRNQTGVADIRVRPRWDEWSALLRIRFDLEQFSPEDVINLMWRAGEQCGIGEGRPNSSSSFGLGWGLFQIDTSKPIGLKEIGAKSIEFSRG